MQDFLTWAMAPNLGLKKIPLFRNLSSEDWFAGLFIWTFYTSLEYVQPWEYTPEGKPAERVIRSWFLEGGRAGR